MPPKSLFLLSLNMPKNEAARGQKRKPNRDGMVGGMIGYRGEDCMKTAVITLKKYFNNFTLFFSRLL